MLEVWWARKAGQSPGNVGEWLSCHEVVGGVLGLKWATDQYHAGFRAGRVGLLPHGYKDCLGAWPGPRDGEGGRRSMSWGAGGGTWQAPACGWVVTCIWSQPIPRGAGTMCLTLGLSPVCRQAGVYHDEPRQGWRRAHTNWRLGWWRKVWSGVRGHRAWHHTES